jgi:hypothetical protein
MGLKPGGTPKDYIRGVFINRKKIVSVGDAREGLQFPSDVAMKLTFEPVQKKDGSGEFSPSMIVYGDFEKDARGLITGWGSAFKIDRLINHIGGYNQEIDSIEIPVAAYACLEGKEIFVLQFVGGISEKTGKPQYKDYQIVANLEEYSGKTKTMVPGDEWLLESFQGQLDRGKIKNFHPECLPDNGATASVAAAPTDDPFASGDDI